MPSIHTITGQHLIDSIRAARLRIIYVAPGISEILANISLCDGAGATVDEADFRSSYGRELLIILRHGTRIQSSDLHPKYHLMAGTAENSRPRDLSSLSRDFHGGITSMNILN